MKIVLIRHGQTKGNILNEQGINLFTGALNNKIYWPNWKRNSRCQATTK